MQRFHIEIARGPNSRLAYSCDTPTGAVDVGRDIKADFEAGHITAFESGLAMGQLGEQLDQYYRDRPGVADEVSGAIVDELGS